jgi:ATP-dependent protease HslVU (ClpYQ) peptidase subunit
MKYECKQYRKNTTKLQRQLIEMAQTLIKENKSINEIYNNLSDVVKDWRKNNPLRREQTYVTYASKYKYNNFNAVYIIEAGGDATIFSIIERLK